MQNSRHHKNRGDATVKRRVVQTCLVPNPHGKLVFAGFPDVYAMLPDVLIAG